jgi:ribosomal protein S7
MGGDTQPTSSDSRNEYGGQGPEETVGFSERKRRLEAARNIAGAASFRTNSSILAIL